MSKMLVLAQKYEDKDFTELYGNYYCSLSEGGTPARFLIIDDGWQQIGHLNKDTNGVIQEGAQ